MSSARLQWTDPLVGGKRSTSSLEELKRSLNRLPLCVAGWRWRNEVWAVGSVLIGARATPLSKSSAWELGGQGRFSSRRSSVWAVSWGEHFSTQSPSDFAPSPQPHLPLSRPLSSTPQGCLPPHPSATSPSLNFQQGTQRTVIDDFSFNICIC